MLRGIKDTGIKGLLTTKTEPFVIKVKRALAIWHRDLESLFLQQEEPRGAGLLSKPPVMPRSRSPVRVCGKPRPQHTNLNTASPTQPQESTFRLTEATPTRWGNQAGLSTTLFPAQAGAGLCLLTCSITGKAPGKFSSPTLLSISSRLF